MPVAARLHAGAATDPGRRRGNNEDRYLCDPARGIFAVVDGMGGEAAGEHAAEIAAKTLQARLERQTGSPADRLREAIALANNEIYEAGRANPEWQGMACVLTAAVVEKGRATVGHVGDSRLYLLRAGRIRKITRDHSPVGEREDRGEIGEAEAMRHPRRNEVYRDVGSAPHRPADRDFIEVSELELPPDAALLLCSDGLSDLVGSAEIRRTVEQHAGDPESGARALVAAANAAGGKDNITVVLVQGAEYSAAPPAPDPGRPARALLGRWAFLTYGAILASLAAWGLRPWLERLLAPAPPAKAAPRTWRVGPGPATDGATISTVLEKAQPGDTVVVEPGEYRELVRARDGVDLVSRDPLAAVLHATGRGVALLVEGVRSGRIRGFTIAGGPQFPMTVGIQVRDSGAVLDALVVTGASTAGVEFAAGGAALLQSSRVIDNPGTGIVVRDAAAPRLANNLIAGNGKTPRAARPGLDIAGTAQPTLEGNTFHDNGAEAIWTRPPGPAPAMLAANFFAAPDKGTPRRRIRVIPR